MANKVFKSIPSVNELLESPQLRGLVDKISHTVVVSEVRTFLDALRSEIKMAAEEMNVPAPSDLAERIAKWIISEQQPRLQPVINATGILLHTGLGRAPLAQSALDHVATVAGGYASVEVDLETGGRSQRVKAVESLLTELTGAEAAAVVNNNAGATLLTLAALAAGREVIVSRGELIEIGGSYRLPDVMEASGCILREVGTTNKTRIADYDKACDENTAVAEKTSAVSTDDLGIDPHVFSRSRPDTCTPPRIPPLRRPATTVGASSRLVARASERRERSRSA